MLRIGHVPLARPTGKQIANIVDLPRITSLPSGRVAALRTSRGRRIPVLFDNLRRRQVFQPMHNPGGPIVTRPQLSRGGLLKRDGWSGGLFFHQLKVYHQGLSRNFCPCIDATVSIIATITVAR